MGFNSGFKGLNWDRGFYTALDLDLYSISSVALYCVGRSLATDKILLSGLPKKFITFAVYI